VRQTWADFFGDTWENVQRFAIDVVYDRQRGRTAWLLAAVLRTLSWVFTGIVRTRTYLYETRVLHDQPLGCLVVVVGNLSVGGTGKTPVVETFARSLLQRGRRVAILSRGYGSRKEPRWQKALRWFTHREAPPPRIVSDGEQLLMGPDQAGDEPYMLARNLPGVVVLVDKNRVKAGQYAIRQFGADVLLLDDGFQYLPLRGQLNLLLIDKNNPFGNRCLLPRGILREPVSHMQRASYVFVTKSDGVADPELEADIRRYKPEGELIECRHAPKYLKSVWGAELLPLEWLKGRAVATFSGIATPESFESFVTGFGASITHNHRFIDHHRFNGHELERFYAAAEGTAATAIITTEKDSVRLRPEWASRQLPIYFLRLEVEILRGAQDFEEAIARICFPKTKVTPTRSPFLSAAQRAPKQP
jgi:tetraacyldisaccharide 4'-kinase